MFKISFNKTKSKIIDYHNNQFIKLMIRNYNYWNINNKIILEIGIVVLIIQKM